MKKKLLIFGAAFCIAGAAHSTTAMAKENANAISVSPYEAEQENEDAGAKINAAIADAVTLGNTDVYLQAGKYNIKSTIKLVSGVNIIADANAQIVRGANVEAVTADTACSDVTISGGKWDGNNFAKEMMDLRGDKLKLVNFSLYGTGYKGIILRGGNDELYNLEVKNNAASGVHLEGTTAQVSNCTFSGNGERGIVITDNANMNMTDCRAFDNGKKHTSVGHGVGIGRGSVATITRSNISLNEQCGISLSGASTVNMVGVNTVNSNGRHGIGTDSSDTVNVSAGSEFNSNGYNGISVGRGSKGNIEDIETKNNAVSGISVNASSATIRNVESTGNKGYGVLTNAAKVYIYETEMSGNGKEGLCASTKSYVWATGCEFNNNKMFGVFAQHAGTKLVILGESTLNNNTRSGVCITTKAKLSLTYSTVSKNGLMGLSFHNGGIANNVRKNVISSHKKCGIYRDGASMKKVKDNKITGTPKAFN